jgi:hypothetical protein
MGRRDPTWQQQWLEACREVRSLTRCAKQNSWLYFVESMKGKTDSSHVWSVIRSPNGKRSPPMARNTVLEHGGKRFVSDTAKADMFTKHYASVSRYKLSRAERKTDRVVHTRSAEDRRNPEPLGPESDKFLMEELVCSLKAGKASGAERLEGLAPLFLEELGGDVQELYAGHLQQVLEGRGLPTSLEGCDDCSHPQAGKTRGSARLLSANRPHVLLSQGDGAHGWEAAPAPCRVMWHVKS